MSARVRLPAPTSIDLPHHHQPPPFTIHLQHRLPRDETKCPLPVPWVPDEAALLECFGGFILGVECSTDLYAEAGGGREQEEGVRLSQEKGSEVYLSSWGMSVLSSTCT